MIAETRAGRDAAIAFVAVLALVAGLVRVDVDVPLVGHLGSALVAVVFLYTPSVVAWRRGEDLIDYGFQAAPIGRGLATAGAAIAVIFPVFVIGYFAFYDTACDGGWLQAHLTLPGACASYPGHHAHWPPIDLKLAEFVAVQLIVVALPEELMFRGCLLGLLERRFPPTRRLWGGGVGIALVVSAAMFALVHLPKEGALGLAVFFPGLLFGWMRSATGSILAGVIVHASSNILVEVLRLSVHR